MLGEYWPILLFLAVASVVGIVLLVVGTTLGRLFAGVAAGGEGAGGDGVSPALGRCAFAALGCWVGCAGEAPGTVTGGNCK